MLAREERVAAPLNISLAPQDGALQRTGDPPPDHREATTLLRLNNIYRKRPGDFYKHLGACGLDHSISHLHLGGHKCVRSR